MRKFWVFLSSEIYRDILGYCFAFLFFYYLIAFAVVAPTNVLVGAVVFEVTLYLCFLAYKLRRRNMSAKTARQIIAKTFLRFIPNGLKVGRSLSASAAVLGSFVMVCVLIDAISFGFALSGNLSVATAFYQSLPVSTLIGCNPGYTLELLSGAKLKAGHYADVQRLYESLLVIRSKQKGLHSEPVCNLYADFGDLAERRKDFNIAEKYYLKAIELSNAIQVPQGCGKFLTRLGELKAAQGKYSEALAILQEAREMRAKIFGAQSQKVGETVMVMARVNRLMGNREKEAKLHIEVQKIRARMRSEAPQNSLVFSSALLSLFIMGAGYLVTARNGWATGVALQKLQRERRKKNISDKDIQEIQNELELLVDYSNGKRLASVSNQKKDEVEDTFRLNPMFLAILD